MPGALPNGVGPGKKGGSEECEGRGCNLKGEKEKSRMWNTCKTGTVEVKPSAAKGIETEWERKEPRTARRNMGTARRVKVFPRSGRTNWQPWASGLKTPGTSSQSPAEGKTTPLQALTGSSRRGNPVDVIHKRKKIKKNLNETAREDGHPRGEQKKKVGRKAKALLKKPHGGAGPGLKIGTWQWKDAKKSKPQPRVPKAILRRRILQLLSGSEDQKGTITLQTLGRLWAAIRGAAGKRNLS